MSIVSVKDQMKKCLTYLKFDNESIEALPQSTDVHIVLGYIEDFAPCLPLLFLRDLLRDLEDQSEELR